MSFRRTAALVTLLLAATACAERGEDGPPTAPPTAAPPVAQAVTPETRELEGVARRLALALADPGFRARLRARLEASPIREHKLHLQRDLAAGGGRERRELARLTRESDRSVDSLLAATRGLEMYFPVPAHRNAWPGDTNLLVATAARDHDVPVAFDVRGRRILLDPDTPPATPVLAVVPVETDFDRPLRSASATCTNCGTGGGGASSGGLYMTRAKFFSDFEGWLKGSPEFEVHIMGQKGTSDSLTRYACAGEHENALYNWDGGTDWSGTVLLFSRPQIDAYQAAHPNEAFRIVAMEDDNTACELKISDNLWSDFIRAIGPLYKDMTGAVDSGDPNRILRAGKSLKNVLTAVMNLIKTNDDLIGTAIEARITGEARTGFNWVLKADGGTTNGWLNLVLE